MQAWHDVVTTSDDTSSTQSDLLIVPALSHGHNEPSHQVDQNVDEVLTVSVDLHDQGMHFGLSSQGDSLLEILLSNPILR